MTGARFEAAGACDCGGLVASASALPPPHPWHRVSAVRAGKNALTNRPATRSICRNPLSCPSWAGSDFRFREQSFQRTAVKVLRLLTSQIADNRTLSMGYDSGAGNAPVRNERQRVRHLY